MPFRQLLEIHILSGWHTWIIFQRVECISEKCTGFQKRKRLYTNVNAKRGNNCYRKTRI